MTHAGILLSKYSKKIQVNNEIQARLNKYRDISLSISTPFFQNTNLSLRTNWKARDTRRKRKKCINGISTIKQSHTHTHTRACIHVDIFFESIFRRIEFPFNSEMNPMTTQRTIRDAAKACVNVNVCVWVRSRFRQFFTHLRQFVKLII